MNYLRQILETEDNRWHSLAEEKPLEGRAVLILFQWGMKDPSCWTTDIAYYSSNGFYYLELDPIVGVLRKTYVTEEVLYWADYIIPDPIKLKE